MSARPHLWAIVLQWSRLGANALVFLWLARWLTLAELGAFAAAIAPARLLQPVFKAGLIDATVIAKRGRAATDTLFCIAVGAGALSTLLLALGALALLQVTTPLPCLLALALSPLPFLQSLAAVPEGLLKRRLDFRALALRTALSQAIAALATMVAAAHGAGPWALVLFVLLNAGLGTAITLSLTHYRPRTRPDPGRIRAALPDLALIAGRDLVSGATHPVLHLGAGLILGLPAAGALQIATRLLGLVDAMALAPLRLVALPRLHRLANSEELTATILHGLRQTMTAAAYLYLGALAAAPELLTLAVGPAHAAEVAPVARLWMLLGLAGAAALIPNEALTALGHPAPVLRRNVAMLCGITLAALPAMALSLDAAAIAAATAATLVSAVHLLRTAQRLSLPRSAALGAVLTPVARGAASSAVVLLLRPILPAHIGPAATLAGLVVIGTLCFHALAPLTIRHAPRPA